MNLSAPATPQSLIGPGVLCLLGLLILWAWAITRQRSLLLTSAAPQLFAVGAAIQLFSMPPGPCLNAITSAFAYTAAVVAVAIGVTLRGPRPLGTRFGIGAGLLIMAGVWFFCTVHDSLLARIYLMNYGYAAILLVAAIRIAPLRHGRREEKALFWSLLVFSLHFFPRVAFTVGLDAEYTSNYDSTVFWVALTLSVTLLGTALIGAVLALAVSDVLDTLRRERDTDTLTGLLNRHGFTTAAGAKLARTETAGLTMVVCDIDRFKSANDAYGHNAGDEVLATVGTLILENLRPGSVAGRLGGDEFVVLLAGTAADATEFADVVGHQLRTTAFSFLPGDGHRITASFGVAPSAPGSTLSGLIATADRQMYAAKAAGRNRAAVATGDCRTPDKQDSSPDASGVDLSP